MDNQIRCMACNKLLGIANKDFNFYVPVVSASFDRHRIRLRLKCPRCSDMNHVEFSTT